MPARVNSPAKTLALLVQHGLQAKDWSAQTAAREAKARGIRGLSARNISAYAACDRKRDPKENLIRKFALLFEESEESWLEKFPAFGLDTILLDRDAIIQEQEKLSRGDEVSLIASRPFLEAHDDDVANLVLRKLDDGVVYRYYFPPAASQTYGDTALASFQRFRQRHVMRHKFKATPLIFGYAVDPAKFRFFSDLHTIVLYRSRSPTFTHARQRENFNIKRAYVFIEAVRGEAGQTEQKWYLLPDDMAKQIASNLDEARSAMPDVDLQILALNPALRRVRTDYLNWFQRTDSPTRYSALRPVLGHSGDRCLRALLAETVRIARDGDSVRYLDIGCGDGELTCAIARYLAQEGCQVKVVGLDPSQSQLDSANACFVMADNIDFSAHVGAFEGFQERESFHLITAIHSFYAIDEAYVRRVFELLAPGGIACIWMAKRQDNVVTALCDALDHEYRPGQKRNAADDVYRYAEAAGLPVEMKSPAGALPRLLDTSGEPTADGQNLIDFCALRAVAKGTKEWYAAVKALSGPQGNDTGDHPLTDGLVVIQRLR
jgi:SAM-dependent methyltransferase